MSRLPRLARIALLVALAAVAASPLGAAAAAANRSEHRPAATAWELLARLWQPVANVFGAADGGPDSDPNGATGSAETDDGPDSDPNG